MASSPITSWEIDGETLADFIFLAPKSLQMVTAAMKLKDTCFLGGKLYHPRERIEKRRHYLADISLSSQSFGFSSSHVWM